MTGKNIVTVVRTYSPDPADPSHFLFENQYKEEGCDPSLLPKYHCVNIEYRDYKNPHYSLFTLGIDSPHPGFSIENRCSYNLIFNCIISGRGTFNGQPFAKGDCYYTKPGQLHTMISDPEDPWVSVWFSVNGALGQQIIGILDQVSDDQMLPICNTEVLFKLAHFYMYQMDFVQHTNDYTRSMLQQLLTFILPEEAQEKEPNATPGRLRSIVDRSVTYIEDNYQTVTVKELAQQVHLEAKYFTKIFTAVTGQSPQEYIVKTKMELACQYLLTTDYSTEKIAELLGYKYRNSLGVAFQKAFGMTLSEYREKHRDSDKKHSLSL